ncbi:MAG: hypothetical protein LBU11_10490, partial [Zoogloeaceae bacterium]|nr:hypothetical protein [Zoogloeaceae bacterium]
MNEKQWTALAPIKQKLVEGKADEGIADLYALTSRTASDDPPNIGLMLAFDVAEETENPLLRRALVNYLLDVARMGDDLLT